MIFSIFAKINEPVLVGVDPPKDYLLENYIWIDIFKAASNP